MSDVDKLLEAVREARAEIVRWRTLKLQSSHDGDYELWERAGRELVHWSLMAEWRSEELVGALLAHGENER